MNATGKRVRLLRAALFLCLGLAVPSRADDASDAFGRAEAAATSMATPRGRPVSGRILPNRKLWVFVVGVLQWEDESYPDFPKKDRRDSLLIEYFRSKGVPPENIVYLQDGQATLARIRGKLSAMLSKSAPGDFLFLYYSGHGARDRARNEYFANYDAGEDLAKTTWAVSSIFDDIESRFKGSRAILASDACFSGSMLQEASRRRGHVSYGILASAHSNSSSTARWTFTDLLLAALRGDRWFDSDGDGQITFQELARHLEWEMAFAERQMAASGATGKFDPEMRIAAVSGKSALSQPRVEARWADGKWYRAQVAETRSSRVKVRDADDQASQWVDKSRVRPYRPPARARGEAVKVKYDGKWYAARIVENRHGLHLVHYEGYAKTADEWVSAERVRGGRN